MRVFIPAVLLSCMLSGCSFLGFQLRRHAERAPPEEAAGIKFPASFENETHVPGPMAVALEVAMNEFLPPGSGITTNDSDKRVANCLSRRSSYEILLMKSSDDLFFVRFIPNLKRCGLEDEILDGGATYAIDGRGRVLDVR
ncbi:hypothetical protein [Archangium violaceum]|uniref:hypothetical protein n=1 Tax=Archangium violaceum TaxID=83451 RepID=UPI0009496FF7|nr:hypothetical protein [Archangium violaceum]